MRIAYIVNYQGPSFANRRPCMHNLSLAARVKVQLIAELLHKSSHEVEIISQGALEPRTPGGAPRSRFYPAFSEEQTFHPAHPGPLPFGARCPIPDRILGESGRAKSYLRRRHRTRRFDLVILYNMQRAQIGGTVCGSAAWAARHPAVRR